MAKVIDPYLNKFIEEMDMSKKHDNPRGKFTTDGKGNETFYINGVNLREVFPDEIKEVEYDTKTKKLTKNISSHEPLNLKRKNAELDLVNHPPHYEGNIECIDAMQEVLGKTGVANFCVGNAFKYIWRCTKKHKSPIEDLKKAKWYIDKAIELISDIEDDEED